tara:strand:- start:1545 stop:1751 length:207 start_codon:yes stop_codon:yes gene_type:complete
MPYSSLEHVDITDRLEKIAKDIYKNDALRGMSLSAMFNEARDEIIRLREELAKEMGKTHLATLRSKRY